MGVEDPAVAKLVGKLVVATGVRIEELATGDQSNGGSAKSVRYGAEHVLWCQLTDNQITRSGNSLCCEVIQTNVDDPVGFASPGLPSRVSIEEFAPCRRCFGDAIDDIIAVSASDLVVAVARVNDVGTFAATDVVVAIAT